MQLRFFRRSTAVLLMIAVLCTPVLGGHPLHAQNAATQVIEYRETFESPVQYVGAQGKQMMKEPLFTYPNSIQVIISPDGKTVALNGLDPQTQQTVFGYRTADGELKPMPLLPNHVLLGLPVFDRQSSLITYSTVDSGVQQAIWAITFVRLSDGLVTVFRGEYVFDPAQAAPDKPEGVANPLAGFDSTAASLLLARYIPFSDAGFIGLARMSFGTPAGGEMPMPALEPVTNVASGPLTPDIAPNGRLVAYPVVDINNPPQGYISFNPFAQPYSGVALADLDDSSVPATISLPPGVGVGYTLDWSEDSGILYFVVGRFNNGDILAEPKLFAYNVASNAYSELGAIGPGGRMSLVGMQICGDHVYFNVNIAEEKASRFVVYGALLANPADQTPLIEGALTGLGACVR